MVKGKSIAPNISLDLNQLTFGNVVVNFEGVMNVVLRNTGDLALKYFKLSYQRHTQNLFQV